MTEQAHSKIPLQYDSVGALDQALRRVGYCWLADGPCLNQWGLIWCQKDSRWFRSPVAAHILTMPRDLRVAFMCRSQTQEPKWMEYTDRTLTILVEPAYAERAEEFLPVVLAWAGEYRFQVGVARR